jgi:tol-pal system protein YbgF
VNPRLAWLPLVVGCATPASALRDDNKHLTDTVSELRAERREQDRKLADLEHQVDQLRAKAVSSIIDGVPTLPVEVAAPPGAVATAGEKIVGTSDDGSEIVYEGDAALGKSAIPESLAGDPPPKQKSAKPSPMAEVPVAPASDRLEVTHKVPVTAARASKPHVRDVPGERSPDAGNEYRAAVDLLRSGHHEEAIIALRAFIQHYPRHDYADNAQYWLGEAYYVQKDYQRALVEFRATIETYPRGNKVPDALLKVGYCYQAMGQPDKARAVLEQVVNLYPKSEPAALAAKKLEAH